MASPRDLTGVLRWWSADAPATTDGGRVTEAPDVVAGSVATRFGQGRVGPELVTVDGRPAWRFGGSASPASLLTPDVPAVSGAPYSWVVVLAPTAGYAGQVLAPGPNSTVTSSSSQLLAETSGSFRWTGFAGASVSLAMPSGEHLVVLDHDGGTGATRLYATGQGSARATLQRRSLAGQQHIGRHGSNDRPLAADVRALLLIDHALSDAEVQTLETWRAEGASSSSRVVRDAGVVAFPARARVSGVTTARRDVATTAPARARLTAATTARRDVTATAPARARLDVPAAARRDVAVALPARARAALPATAAADVAVTAPARARAALPATARRDAPVLLPAAARLDVDATTSRHVVLDVDVALPAVAALRVAVEAVRDVGVALPARGRVDALTRAHRDVGARFPTAARLGAPAAALRDVVVRAGASARLDVPAAARRDVAVVLEARARLDALVELVRAAARAVAVRAYSPRPTWQAGAPAPVYAASSPRPAWLTRGGPVRVPWISNEPVVVPFGPADRRQVLDVVSAQACALTAEAGMPDEGDWRPARYTGAAVVIDVPQLGTPGPGDYRLWTRLVLAEVGPGPVRDFPLSLTG